MAASSKLLLLKSRTVDDKYATYHERSNNNTSCNLHFLKVIDHVAENIEEMTEFLCLSNNLSEISALIITSQRAVESLVKIISRIRNDWVVDTILAKPIFVVGPQTASMLSNHGFSDIRGEDSGNANELVKVILQDDLISHIQAEANQSNYLLFLTGRIRKDIIPTKLGENGVKFIEKIVYRTIETSNTLEKFQNLELSSKTNDWVVFFSTQGVDLIIDQIKQNALHENDQLKIASIGPTTSEALQKKGVICHVVTPKPNPSALFDAIFEYEERNCQQAKKFDCLCN
ncbi:uroporphyrinogen-III synthase [Saccharomycopsis crataegensis]|uniref:Uroporphyrinogen-III synthase n=1 Tax=Saccharomycopsis crataegensis TaxID=43959 RepID=A0AAV5QJA3_9ASCO|nr:uroporphyrinogen-III synthase [Saccharomycopsis crataegensis]